MTRAQRLREADAQLDRAVGSAIVWTLAIPLGAWFYYIWGWRGLVCGMAFSITWDGIRLYRARAALSEAARLADVELETKED